MKCDSRASFLAHTFVSPCFVRKPKAKVATQNMFKMGLNFELSPFWLQPKAFTI
jgi:hypothetical protein